MKANNYIKQLKEIVNNNVLESIECVNYGVQAYGISANEYEVITKFAKINGRYYFIDRDGNKYLASRYDRAELVACDILDNVQYATETAQEYVCKLEEKKMVSVDAAHLFLFFDFCDLLGFEVESVENHYHEDGEMYTVYRIKNAKNDVYGNETAADEQQTESEATATTCEPSKFAGILAKAETAAAKLKAFFSILAKMEWYSFILFGPSLVMLGVVVNCIYLLASGACPDMGRAVEGVVLFALLAFAFAFGGFVMASDEWDEAKKEILIYNK